MMDITKVFRFALDVAIVMALVFIAHLLAGVFQADASRTIAITALCWAVAGGRQ